MARYKKNQEYSTFKLRVNAQGRVVIPAPMRKALDIKPGSVIEGRIEGERVVLINENARSLEETLRANRSDVISRIQDASVEKGLDKMTLQEINREIKAYRDSKIDKGRL